MESLYYSILSQSYNATVFNFDNICFPRTCIKLIIYPKRKFNQSSILPHSGFHDLFPTVQETTHLTAEGWLKKKKKMKCMVMYQYPTCDMHFVQRKRCIEY